MKKEWSRWLIIWICGVAATIILSCAPAIKPPKMTAEEVLRRRVEEYWSCRIEGKWEKAYEYEVPDYRESQDIVKYTFQMRRAIVRWRGFDIQEIWTVRNEGYVKLNLRYGYQMPEVRDAVFQRVTEEKWINKDGVWYHVFFQ